MKLNLYDFDGTIYDGDSSFDFFKFCVRKDKRVLRNIGKISINFLRYKTKYITLTEFKECVFSFLNYFDNIDDLIEEFWLTHEKKLKDFYLATDHSNDVIISASPDFLLKPVCDKLGVRDLIASSVDKRTGHFDKPNNRGEEKVKEFRRKYPKAIISKMYSDSMHDKPLLELAKRSYMVKRNKVYDYKTYKPSLFKRFWNWGWGIYHKNEEFWNYLIIGALTTLVSILTYALFSKIFGINYLIATVLSWILTVIFAYFTNRWFVFHSLNKNVFKEFISFTSSRLLTLIMEEVFMVLFVDCFRIDDLISKVIVQFVILVCNYLLSKLIVFKKKKS
jgi:HAD superfamily phosphoserine phosphatase-like hydrolase